MKLTKIPCGEPGCAVLVTRGKCRPHRMKAWKKANRLKISEYDRLRRKLHPRPFPNVCRDCGCGCYGAERCNVCNARVQGKLGGRKGGR